MKKLFKKYGARKVAYDDDPKEFYYKIDIDIFCVIHEPDTKVTYVFIGDYDYEFQSKKQVKKAIKLIKKLDKILNKEA